MAVCDGVAVDDGSCVAVLVGLAAVVSVAVGLGGVAVEVADGTLVVVGVAPPVTGSPVQTPSTHISGPVQSLPSSHATLLSGGFTQPLVGSHVSGAVQGSPSSHGVAILSHMPLLGLQNSNVQALPSSGQFTFGDGKQSPSVWQVKAKQSVSVPQAVPMLFGVPVQMPTTQVSPVVHSRPSSHAPPLIGICRQPKAGLQESVVQGLPSSQSSALVSHMPVDGLHETVVH